MRVEPGFLQVGAAVSLIGQRFFYTQLKLFIFMLNLFLTGQRQLEMDTIMGFFIEFESCELNARLCELNRDSYELELLFR
jgi:hypothetical protein